MSIAALSSAGSVQDVAPPPKVQQALPPSSTEVRIVDTRNRPALDRTAALVKDEYDVGSSSNVSIDSEEAESEGLSVYA
jgi:hypothetical protein